MNDEIKILITGDLCPHNRIEDLALRSDYASVFNDFIDVFRNNDLNITDLECPLTLSEKGRNKTGPHQKADPACIGLLKYADFKLVALANNHIMDYSSVGVKQTMELCQQNKIHTVGAGSDTESAGKPFIVDIKDKKICIFNMADQEFLTATDGKYQANPVSTIDNYYDIQNARRLYDYIIVIIHGGNEFYHLPSPRTKKLFRFFIDAGADAVISNHTHCFSGFEVYSEKPVFYGLGNFIYDWPGKINSFWNKGYVVKLILTDRINFEIIPLNQCNEFPGVFHLNENENMVFLQELDRLNKIIADDDKLDEAFQHYIKSVTPMYDAFLEPYFGRIYNALRQRGFLPDLLNRKKRLLLLNLIRCEAHREVVLGILKKYE